MFAQIFRNKIYESRKFKTALKHLDRFIGIHKSLREEEVIGGLAQLWKQQGSIVLGNYPISGRQYKLTADFLVEKTHGPPYVTVTNTIDDSVTVNSKTINFPTEFGDLAIIVDYLLDSRSISRKLSIIQSKKEFTPGQAKIQLHQLYLMDNWPNLIINGTEYHFPQIKCSDYFAFYHFILDKSGNKRYPSSLCSAPYVSSNLEITKQDIENALIDWCEKRKTLKKMPPPDETLSMPLVPGLIYCYGKSYEWNKMMRPFYQFLLDAANQTIGTSDEKLLEIVTKKSRILLR